MSAQKFISKPTVKEAMLYDGTGRCLDELRKWGYGMQGFDVSLDNQIIIQTLEGEMLANPGDYIIKGIRGEFYPCKAEIFLESYKPVEPEQARPLCERNITMSHKEVSVLFRSLMDMVDRGIIIKDTWNKLYEYKVAWFEKNEGRFK